VPVIEKGMEPAIVVEIAPGAPAPDEQALVASCDLGMRGRARCLLRDEAAGDRVAFASVTWEESAHGVRASVGVRVSAPNREATRELPFSEADPELERWRATGFAIASMVGDIIDPPARDEAVAAAPPERAPPAAQASRAGQAAWWVDGRLAAQRGADGSSPALGAELGLSRMLAAGRWFGSASLGCSDQVSHGVEIVRPGASLGLGLVVLRVRDEVSLSLRLAPRLEYVEATARNAAGVEGQASRWVLGAGEGFDVAWLSRSGFGVAGGAELRELAGTTAFDAYGRLLTQIPAVDFVVQGGLRYGLP
jgi:hypothetical protein